MKVWQVSIVGERPREIKAASMTIEGGALIFRDRRNVVVEAWGPTAWWSVRETA